MIRNYFRMKRNEWKIKAVLYGVIAGIMDNKKDIIDLVQRMYAALKDVPVEELKSELLMQVAKLAHEQAATES